jgi:hypothetical protein
MFKWLDKDAWWLRQSLADIMTERRALASNETGTPYIIVFSFVIYFKCENPIKILYRIIQCGGQQWTTLRTMICRRNRRINLRYISSFKHEITPKTLFVGIFSLLIPLHPLMHLKCICLVRSYRMCATLAGRQVLQRYRQ